MKILNSIPFLSVVTYRQIKGKAVTTVLEAQKDLPTFISRRLLGRMWAMVTFLLVLPTLLSLGARYHWSLDLLTSFHVQYAAGLVPMVILFFVKRHWWKGTVLSLSLFYNLALILPVYLPIADRTEGDPSLRLLVTNVWSSNEQHPLLIDLIQRETPDVVLALEVNGAWMTALQELTDEYPYVKSVARNDNFGIALFSKYPFQKAEILKLGDSQLPSVFAEISLNETTVVSLLGTHPLPPAGSAAAYRNQQLNEVANIAAKLTGHVIVCGDLNLTPWSPHWHEFLNRAGLRDSRQGFGTQPTWPAGKRLLRIPIDHILVGDGISVDDRRIGCNIGSDHLPVIADFSFTKE